MFGSSKSSVKRSISLLHLLFTTCIVFVSFVDLCFVLFWFTRNTPLRIFSFVLIISQTTFFVMLYLFYISLIDKMTVAQKTSAEAHHIRPTRPTTIVTHPKPHHTRSAASPTRCTTISLRLTPSITLTAHSPCYLHVICMLSYLLHTIYCFVFWFFFFCCVVFFVNYRVYAQFRHVPTLFLSRFLFFLLSNTSFIFIWCFVLFYYFVVDIYLMIKKKINTNKNRIGIQKEKRITMINVMYNM